MTVYLAESPADAASVMEAPLAHLLGSHFAGVNGLGGSETLQPSAPMALFTLGVNDIISDHALSIAKPTGWRFILMGADHEPVAVADMRDGTGGTPPEFDSLVQGTLPARLLHATQLAEERYGSEGPRYEARVLEIPALYETALWLHGDSDIFFPVLESGTRATQAVEQDPHFLARLRHEAARRTAPAQPQAKRKTTSPGRAAADG